MANLHGADHPRSLDERRKVTANALVRDQVSHHDTRADAQRRVHVGNPVAEAVGTLEIDDDGGP